MTSATIAEMHHQPACHGQRTWPTVLPFLAQEYRNGTAATRLQLVVFMPESAAATSAYSSSHLAMTDVLFVGWLAVPPVSTHHACVNNAEPFQTLRDELDDIATGRRKLTVAETHVFIDQAASVIRKIIGHLPHCCAQHLACATTAAMTDTLPKFIHEIEAAMMHAEQLVGKTRHHRPH